MDKSKPDMTVEEQIVDRWNRGDSAIAIGRSVNWRPTDVALLLRQIRKLGVPLRVPPPPPGEHELDLESLSRRIDLQRMKAIAIAAKRGDG